MPDIFISYKSDERPFAERLATRLTEAGYDVWWDAALLAGQRFEDVIARALRDARTVVILWSHLSVESNWVKDEAAEALSAGKAIPTIIDDLQHDALPLTFRRVHTPRLTGWDGDITHPGYRDLFDAIALLAGAAQGPKLSPPQAAAKLEKSAGEAEVWAAVTNSPMQSADEYRAYLTRFGETALFADLARIRIARLDPVDKTPAHREPLKDSKKKNDGTRSPLARWWPAIVLPVLALLIIAGVGVWYWQQHPDMFISEEVKDAAARCTGWSQSSNLNWKTAIPELGPTTAGDCRTAATGYPQNGDFQGMLALVEAAQGGDGSAAANRGVELGSALSSYALGLMWERGLSFKADPQKAAEFYKTAYKMKYLRAGGRLCYIATDAVSSTFVGTPDEILAYCNAAADVGDPLALTMLGYYHENNNFNFGVDDVTASKLYRQAADQGFVMAKVFLGSVDLRGEGLAHNYDEAFSLFREVAATGYPLALRWLAIAYELGLGTPVDFARAGQNYNQAFLGGDVVATFLLGFSVESGIAGSNFFDNEIDRLAANPSDAVGQRMLGQELERGFMRDKNVPQAVAAYSRCAGNNPLCQFILGSYYKYRALTADLPKAAQLYEKSAAAGELHSQYELALMYENGEGEPLDVAKAIDLYSASAAQGYVPASAAVRRLTQGGSTAPKS